MSDESYFVIPSDEEFVDWSPVATNFKIWANRINQSTRIYCNKGKLYVKFPNSEWRRIVCFTEYNSKSFKTTIDLFPPITKDKPEPEEKTEDND